MKLLLSKFLLFLKNEERAGNLIFAFVINENADIAFVSNAPPDMIPDALKDINRVTSEIINDIPSFNRDVNPS